MFAGITDTNTWRFTVTTDMNWSLTAYWPLNDGTDGQTVTTADGPITLRSLSLHGMAGLRAPYAAETAVTPCNRSKGE